MKSPEYWAPPSPDGPVKAANICFFIAIGSACLPFVGFGSWLISGPLFLATFILSIVAISRGATKAGISGILCSMLVGPVIVAIMPFLSTGIAAMKMAPKIPEDQQAQVEAAPSGVPQPVIQAAPRPMTTAEAQAAAVKQYPALGVSGSPFNSRFLELYKGYKSSQPAFFASPDWPLRLANLVNESQSLAGTK